MKRVAAWIIRLFLLLAIVLLWLFTGERQIPFAASLMEGWMNRHLDVHQLSLQKTTFHFLGPQTGVKISAKEMVLSDKNSGQILANMPNSSIVLRMDSASSSQIEISTIAIDNVRWFIPFIDAQKEQKKLRIADGGGSESSRQHSMLNGMLENSFFASIRSLTLNNATVLLEYDPYKSALEIPLKHVRITQESENHYTLEGLCLTGEEAFTLRSQAVREASGDIIVSGDMEDVTLHALWDMLQQGPEWRANPITTQLDFSARINANGVFDIADIQLKNQSETVPFSASIAVENNDGLRMVGHADIGAFSMDDVPHIWPVNIAPRTRNWALSRVTGAQVSKGHLSFSYDQQMELEGEVKFSGADVDYRGAKYALPPISQASGVMSFKKGAMHLLAKTGRMLNSEIRNADFTIHHVGKKEAYFTLELESRGPASDLAFFPKIFLSKNQMVQRMLKKYRLSGGQAVSQLTMHAPMKPKRRLDEHHVQIKSQLSNLLVAYQGEQVPLGDAEMEYNHFNAHTDKLNADMTMQVQGDVPDAALRALNLPLSQYVSGVLGLDALLKIRNKVPVWELRGDVARAAIDIPIAGLHKPKGVVLNLSGTFDQLKNGKGRLASFDAKGTDILAEGSGHFSQKAGQDFAFTFDKIAYGRTKASGSIARKENAYHLVVQGSQIDLQHLFGQKTTKQKVQKAASRPYHVSLKANRLLGKKELAVENATLTYSSQPLAMHIKANDGSDLRFKDHMLNGKLMNMGHYLSIFGLQEGLFGGTMTAKSHKGRDGRYYTDITVEKFRVKHFPVLSELLNFASFTSIVNILDGKGVSFRKLKAKMHYVPKAMLYLTDLRAHGGALGVTGEGSYHLGKKQLNITGTLIPAYLVSHILSEIPLLGDLILGGDEGLIATNYKMEGTADNPRITVNPLSMLTPGFLRKVWDIDD